MIFPEVLFVARERSPKAGKHRVKMNILSRSTVAAINLETPRFFYCKLFVTLTMLLTYLSNSAATVC
jgi:hypothetical protein